MEGRTFCKSTEIKEIEENCFRNGMPVVALMEKAALKSSVLFKKIYPKSQFLKVAIFVGPGHNGGDALVMARELFLSGYKTYIYLPQDKLKKIPGDHLSYYLFLGGQVLDKIEHLLDMNVIIDGLFGFGLKKVLDQKFIELIQIINNSQISTVSLDLPSGLDADFGTTWGACVHATHTFCLGIYKPGLIHDHAVDYVGKLHFIDIGLNKIIENKSSQVKALFSNICRSSIIERQNDRSSQIKKRNLNKYTNGVCFLFAGSNKYPGAGILSARGALAAGAGYIQLCCTEEIKYPTISQLPELIFLDLKASLEQISKHISNKFLSILCGPGLENDYLKEIIEKINSNNIAYPCLIIDASSLTMQNYNLIKEYKGEKILTPHLGEFKKIFPHIHERLIKENTCQISSLSLNKIDAVKLAAHEINGIVLLKGPHTVIANAQGECFVDIKSTSALARAGCGDVLSGFISGLIAKGYSPIYAACFSVFMQSKTAIDLEKQFGRAYVCASHLAEKLGARGRERKK